MEVSEKNTDDQGVPEWVMDWAKRHGWLRTADEKLEDVIPLPSSPEEAWEYIEKLDEPPEGKYDKEDDPSVCECIQRLRNFRLLGVHNLRRLIELSPERLGPHNIPEPEDIEEDLEDAVNSIRFFWEEYASKCPYTADSRLLAFVDAVEKHDQEEEPEFYRYSDIRQTGSTLVWAGVEGIARNVEGPRIDPGPFSYNPAPAQMCSNALFEIEEYLWELDEGIHEANLPLEDWQRRHLEDFNLRSVNEAESYMDYCKPYGSLKDLTPIREHIESRGPFLEQYTVGLETVEDNQSQEWFSKKLIQEIEITKNIIETILEDEWLTHCGMLEWKGEIKPDRIGSHYQLVDKPNL